MSDKKSVYEKFRQFLYRNLEEKGLAGTDASFRSPVVTYKEYHDLMRKLQKQYGKKGKKKTNPFKDAVKAEEERRMLEKWDKQLDYIEKNYSPEKGNKIIDKLHEDHEKHEKLRKKYPNLRVT